MYLITGNHETDPRTINAQTFLNQSRHATSLIRESFCCALFEFKKGILLETWPLDICQQRTPNTFKRLPVSQINSAVRDVMAGPQAQCANVVRSDNGAARRLELSTFCR